MASRRIRKEYKAACEALDALMQEERSAGGRGPLPEKVGLYLRLSAIKNTLEWCEPILVKTGKAGPNPTATCSRYAELMGYRHIAGGPVFAELYP
jgi:hypothetical protein